MGPLKRSEVTTREILKFSSRGEGNIKMQLTDWRVFIWATGIECMRSSIPRISQSSRGVSVWLACVLSCSVGGHSMNLKVAASECSVDDDCFSIMRQFSFCVFIRNYLRCPFSLAHPFALLDLCTRNQQCRIAPFRWTNYMVFSIQLCVLCCAMWVNMRKPILCSLLSHVKRETT